MQTDKLNGGLMFIIDESKKMLTSSITRNLFLLTWIALWSYLSLGMVVLSFSAIQFQTTIYDEARREALAASGKGSNSITVAIIRLKHDRYKENLALLDSLKKTNPNGIDKAGNDYPKLRELTSFLYSTLFGPDEGVPNDVIGEITSRCKKQGLQQDIIAKCAEFADAVAAPAPTPNGAATAGADLNVSELNQVSIDIKDYEDSFSYSQADDLDGQSKITALIFPWFPQDILLPALPHPVLVLIVTLSMGALGSVLFMLQLHFINQERAAGHSVSVSWHLFRPLQGMATALAIFLLVKAGQLSVSSGDTLGADSGELNVFVLGFLGVVSGLLSDSAIERLSAAGVELLRISPPTRTSRENLDRPIPGAEASRETEFTNGERASGAVENSVEEATAGDRDVTRGAQDEPASIDSENEEPSISSTEAVPKGSTE